jgi:hypothetical protein
MIYAQPDAANLLANTRTTTGTLLTIPAGKWFTGTLVLSATVAVAGASSPTVSISGTDASPADGTVLHRINLSGLVGNIVSDSCTTEILVAAPSGNDVTLEFTAGANGTSSASINGFLI